jgi:hypothetical protein
MNRTFSVIRRRPNYVDFITSIVPSVVGYRLKWAANFDGAFADVFTTTNVGMRDASINPAVIDVQQTQGRVRVVFDPANYSIPDDLPFWIKLYHVDNLGAETAVSAATLLLPESAHHGIPQVTLHGTAPSAPNSSGALQLDFPRLMTDFRIHNEEAATALYVSTEEGGAEQRLDKDTSPQYTNFSSTLSSIWVRGGGGTATFSAICTAAFPR